MSNYEDTNSALDTKNETPTSETGVLETKEAQVNQQLSKEMSDEVNRKVNSLITARLKAFEAKLDKLIPQSAPEVKKLPEEIDALVEIKQIKAQLAQAQEKTKQSRVKEALVTSLSSKGVIGEQQSTAIKAIIADNLLEVTDEGVYFKNEMGVGTLDAGLNEWLSNKTFLVAQKQTIGTGTTSVQTNNKSTNPKVRPGDLLAQLSKKR